MPMNRVQFQPGLSMHEFVDLYGTDDKCELAVKSWRWPQGFVCPACGQAEHSEFRRGSLLYFQCRACRRQTSLISGSVFGSTKLPLRLWFLAMHLLTQAKNGVSSLELMRHIGASYPTAWAIKHKLMEAMRQREESRQLTGRIEIDDAYLGGECVGGKAGRGSPNKVPFVAAVQTTEAGQPVLACLSKRPFTSEAIEQFMERSVVAPATVVSDGLACFNVVKERGIRHERHVTGGGAASSKRPEFAAVNTILGNLKTAFSGTYHAFEFSKYADRYLAQVQYCFNRRFNLRTILERLARTVCLTEHRSIPALRLAEVAC